MKNKIAIFGGTPIDTAFGGKFVSSLGYNDVIVFSTAQSPSEQNRLQLLNPKFLQEICESKCREFYELGYNVILIYCNSLTSVLDLNALKKDYNLYIITPRDVYKIISCKYNRVMIFAANASGSKLAEESLLNFRPIETATFGCIDIVHAIEGGNSPDLIYSQLDLGNLIQFSEKNKFEVIVLSCTHFPYIQKVIEKNSPIPVIDLNMGLGSILKKYLQ